MSNSYYHSFVPGFNFWYVFVPLTLVILAYVGYRNLRLSKGKIRRCVGSRFYSFLAMVFSIVTFVLVSVESGRGIIQYLDNGLSAYESPVWSIFGAAFVIMTIAILEYCLCKAAAKFGEDLKREKIMEHRRTQKAREEESNILYLPSRTERKEISAR